MPYNKPFQRKLRGYAFDPSFSATLSRRQSNEVIYKIKWEETEPGPRGQYVEVIDFDPTTRRFYDAINLNHPYVLADHGLAPSQGDPRFHQQQVYAVVMSVIHQFERALGRKIIWSRFDADNPSGPVHEFIAQLRIYPHAMRQQNAYYSPAKNALLFGYFQASDSWEGNNIPGSAIFTCLSPDIIAHETTHAILDSIHPFLTRDTNLDMLAFHEGFADIIALLQRFSFRNVVEEQIRNSRGDMLSPENLLGDLAIQFGQAISGNRRALRSYLVEKDDKKNYKTVDPNPALIHTETDPHKRGALLVAAVFDAFARLYKYKVADLIRLASDGTGILAQGEIDPDLVCRLAEEACHIADKLMQVCIRALDYCPPADLTFGDYLRALVTADVNYNPDDEEGVRYAIMESFRRWGIVPPEVNTFSVESLRWKSPREYFVEAGKLFDLENAIKHCFEDRHTSVMDNQTNDYEKMQITELIERILRENDREQIFNLSQTLGKFVHKEFYKNIDRYRNKPETLLGMSFEGAEYKRKKVGSDDVEYRVFAPENDVFQVYKCRPMIIPDPHSGNSIKVMLLMFLQQITVNLGDSPYAGLFNKNEYSFRGGASLLIDMSNYEIKYIISKSVTNEVRLFNQLDYALSHGADEENSALLMQEKEPFAALHFH